MMRFLILTMFLVMTAKCGRAQQDVPSDLSKATGSKLMSVKVFAVGAEVTAPEILPVAPPVFSGDKCKEKLNGEVSISFLVDTSGRSRNLVFLKPLGSDLDMVALRILAADRFKPATRDGVSVVVEQSAEIKLRGCVEQYQDSTGRAAYRLRLSSMPQQTFKNTANPPEEAVLTSASSSPTDLSGSSSPSYQVGGAVSAPVLLIAPAPDYTLKARQAKISGMCVIAAIVDANGMPQKIEVKRSFDPELDQNAMAAVSRYRFKPARVDGQAVPVLINIQVKFQIY
jgi:TonB family protein